MDIVLVVMHHQFPVLMEEAISGLVNNYCSFFCFGGEYGDCCYMREKEGEKDLFLKLLIALFKWLTFMYLSMFCLLMII